jgi:hypothetical protein
MNTANTNPAIANMTLEMAILIEAGFSARYGSKRFVQLEAELGAMGLRIVRTGGGYRGAGATRWAAEPIPGARDWHAATTRAREIYEAWESEGATA